MVSVVSSGGRNRLSPRFSSVHTHLHDTGSMELCRCKVEGLGWVRFCSQGKAMPRYWLENPTHLEQQGAQQLIWEVARPWLASLIW